MHYPSELNIIKQKVVHFLETLGQRIKAIRKRKKLTLVDVAGTRMTKGMLSLIENNKAQPSMENLQFIAQQLAVDIGTLTDVFPTEELRFYIDEVRKISATNDNLSIKQANAIEQLLHPIIERLPEKYESSQLLLAYINTFIPRKRYKDGIKQCDLALELLDKLSLYSEYVEVLAKKSNLLFFSNHYDEAYNTISAAYNMVNSTYYSVNVLTKIHVLYKEATFKIASTYATNDSQSIDELIAFCHQEKIFYFYTHIIRFATYLAILNKDDEKVAYYRDRLERYSQFDTNEETKSYYHMYYLIYYSIYDKQPEKVIKYSQLLINSSSNLTSFAIAELGIAYYTLQQYDKAYETFAHLPKNPDYTGLHPIDQSRMHVSYSYKALTHFHFNEMKEAAYYSELAYLDSLKIIAMQERPFITDVFTKIHS